ncbi:MAG: hypothetical protein RBQ97_08230 [Acholeplasma sp.]|nr:hypothetical protein [Acholeplasma sp.]
MKKNKKYLGLMILVLLFVAASATTVYAFWGNVFEKKLDNTLTIGEGFEMTVSATTADHSGKVLVPSTVVQKNGDVTSLEFTYTVELTDIPQNNLKLQITTNNIKIGDDATHNSLVILTVLHSIDDEITWNNIMNNLPTFLDNDNLRKIKVKVIMELIEPIDESQYNAIKGKNITFDIIFKAQE